MTFELGGGGDFFTPAVGRYVGQFLGTTDGPKQHYAAEGDKPARDGDTILWHFALYNTDGSPVLDPKTGTGPAIAEGMSSNTVGKGRQGNPAKARTWITKLLESNGLAWVEPTSKEQVDAMVAASVGVFAYVVFGAPKQKVVLTEIERFTPQPANRPVPPAIPARTVAPAAAAPVAFGAPVAAPAAFAPQPVAAPVQPLAVPMATAFVPTPVPVAIPTPEPVAQAAPAVPVMPFPVAVA